MGLAVHAAFRGERRDLASHGGERPRAVVRHLGGGDAPVQVAALFQESAKARSSVCQGPSARAAAARAHSTSAGAVSQATSGRRSSASRTSPLSTAPPPSATTHGLTQRVLEHLDDDVALDAAKPLLAASSEDLGDGAFAPLDERVGVDERNSEALRDSLPTALLPAPMKPTKATADARGASIAGGAPHRLRQ